MSVVRALVQVRLGMYRKRKIYLEGMLTAESAKLTNQARFIVEIISKELVIGKHLPRVIPGLDMYMCNVNRLCVYTCTCMYMYIL